MDIAIITKVAQSVQRLLPHKREDAHTTRQLHFQRLSGPFHAKRAAKMMVVWYSRV